jgi:GMP synthase (glutamine-hydrolysing)
MTDVLALRHVAFEDLGILEGVFNSRGWRFRYHDVGIDSFDQLDPLKDDLVVVLGGPIGVHDDDQYPFIKSEIAFLQKRLTALKPTLGLCLGAQLIAKALGANVYPGPMKEIGWSPLQLTGAGHTSPCKHLTADQAFMFHWHGDTFDLPDDAVLLASTEVCRNQVFVWNDVVMAFQCHPEVRRSNLERWFIGHAFEIANTPGLHAKNLRADTQRYAANLERQGRLCFNAWLDTLNIK